LNGSAAISIVNPVAPRGPPALEAAAKLTTGPGYFNFSAEGDLFGEIEVSMALFSTWNKENLTPPRLGAGSLGFVASVKIDSLIDMAMSRLDEFVERIQNVTSQAKAKLKDASDNHPHCYTAPPCAQVCAPLGVPTLVGSGFKGMMELDARVSNRLWTQLAAAVDTLDQAKVDLRDMSAAASELSAQDVVAAYVDQRVAMGEEAFVDASGHHQVDTQSLANLVEIRTRIALQQAAVASSGQQMLHAQLVQLGDAISTTEREIVPLYQLLELRAAQGNVSNSCARQFDACRLDCEVYLVQNAAFTALINAGSKALAAVQAILDKVAAWLRQNMNSFQLVVSGAWGTDDKSLTVTFTRTSITGEVGTGSFALAMPLRVDRLARQVWQLFECDLFKQYKDVLSKIPGLKEPTNC